MTTLKVEGSKGLHDQLNTWVNVLKLQYIHPKKHIQYNADYKYLDIETFSAVLSVHSHKLDFKSNDYYKVKVLNLSFILRLFTSTSNELCGNCSPLNT